MRKETKAHGLQRKIEGPPLEPGERCLIVEDVVTTGGSTVQAIEAVRAEGYDVVGVVSILDRLAGGAAAIALASGDAPYEAAGDDRRRLPGPPGPASANSAPPRALVAQWIEHAPPKRGMQVRFLSSELRGQSEKGMGTGIGWCARCRLFAGSGN